MCWLCLYPPGVDVDEFDLARVVQLHRDGYGHAVFNDGGRLITETTMDAGDAIDRFVYRRRMLPHQWAAFHARWATTGEVCEAECHPFTVRNNERDVTTAVFVNGTLDIPLRPGENDTQKFAANYLTGDYRGHVSLDDGMTRESFDRMCQRTNAKMVIMSDDPDYYEQVYIYNQDQWIRTPYGAYASNADHMPQGTGWDECYVCPECGYSANTTIAKGACPFHGAGMELWRFNLPQDGQCANCHLFGHETGTCAVEHTTPFRWRNETAHQRHYYAGKEV